MKLNSRGIISPLIFVYVAVAAFIVLFLVIGNLPIKDKLLGGLFPQMASQAAGVVDVELVPNAVSVSKDQTFLVDVAVDAKTERIGAVNIDLAFDPQLLELKTVGQGFYLPVLLDPVVRDANGDIVFNSQGQATLDIARAIDNTNGRAKISLGALPNAYPTGNGNVVTFEFKALQPTTTTTSILLLDTTGVAAIGKTGNQIGALVNSTVTITNTPAVTKTAQFSLNAPAGATAGQNFNVSLRAQTNEEANLFASRLNFNPALLEVVSISTAGSFITQWVNDNSFDNATGQISLIGGVPTPGYKNTAPSTMATVTFRAKAAGTAAITFGANSAIYRNSDNKDILVTPVTASSTTITGVAPSPSPSAVPSVSPSVAPSPSAAASVAPSPSAGASVAPSPSASAAASVAPSPSTIASIAPSPSAGITCTLTSANWVTSSNPVSEGKVVGLNVVGSAGCAGQSISFTVLENDSVLGIGGTDPTRNSPPTSRFNSSGVATTNWLAEYQDDPSVIENNVPEYYFRAQLASGESITSANPELKVTALAGGIFLTGDINKDGVVDLVDLSIMLSNWNKTSDFIDALDLNQDGTVNAVDWGTLIQILRVTGVIAS